MIDTSATSVNLYDRAPSKAGRWAVPCIAILCGISFFIGLDREPHFVDESAYVSQAYFGDLFITGSIHSPLWFEYPAYDLPPLTKYLVWSGLVTGGDPRPGPSAMRSWYSDTSKRFETVSSLRHARQPIALCGLITVLATGLIAQRWRGNLVAICSMILVTIHPLFRTHARRSMADIPTEMGVALALLAFMPIVGKQKPAWRMVILGGIATGLAASSKLNGLLAGIVLIAWALAGIEQNRNRIRGIVCMLLAGIIGATFFILLNPFFYSYPQGIKDPSLNTISEMGLWGRIKFVIDHRVGVSSQGQKSFPNDALTTIPDKAKALVVQGFGRFSPFGPRPDDSRIRYEFRQDGSALIWLPLVIFGAVVAFRDTGKYQNGRLILIYWICSIIVVGSFLPLAWNRYYLPIVIPSIILASGGIGWAMEYLKTKLGPL